MEQMTVLNLTDLLFSAATKGHPSSLLIEGILADPEQDPDFQDLQHLLAGSEYYSQEVLKLISIQVITIFMKLLNDGRLNAIRQANLVSIKENLYVHH